MGKATAAAPISALCFPNFCFSLRLRVFALKVFCMLAAKQTGAQTDGVGIAQRRHVIAADHSLR